MSWESRGSKTYYYTKKRVGGRVISEYAGQRWIANLVAAIDARERHDRNRARHDLATIIQVHRRVDGLLDSYRRQVRAVVASALQQAGYHQHKRGEWRLKRGGAMEISKSVEGMQVQHLGIMAGSVEKEILRCCGVGKSPETAKLILAEVAGIRAGLGWEASPLHERLLIETISLCWLRLQLLEQFYSQHTGTDGYKLSHAEHFERRLSATHRRYLEAVTALARVRRLGINVQINVANQQVVQNG